MYRIRSSSGEEAVFKTLEEFNAAVRSGIIAAEDEIFHSRANKWLDVRSHPHYRSALGLGEENGNGHAPRLTPPSSAKPTLSPFGVQAAPPSLSKPARQHSGQRPAIGTAPRPDLGDSQKQPALTSSGARPALTQARPALNGPATAPKPTIRRPLRRLPRTRPWMPSRWRLRRAPSLRLPLLLLRRQSRLLRPSQRRARNCSSSTWNFPSPSQHRSRNQLRMNSSSRAMGLIARSAIRTGIGP
jgi:hypothetical protein